METRSKRIKRVSGGDVSPKKKKLIPAWHDDDDEISDAKGIEGRKVKLEAKPDALYQHRLNDAFEATYGPTPEWAKKPTSNNSVEDDSENDHSVSAYTSRLPPHQLEFDRTTPLPYDPAWAGYIIRSIKFNPTSNLVALMGQHGTHVVSVKSGTTATSREAHTLVTSIQFPAEEGTWSASGNNIYFTHRDYHMFKNYDMQTAACTTAKPNNSTKDDRIKKIVADPSSRLLIGLGTSGKVYVFSAGTAELVDTLHMGENVDDAAFSSDGKVLYTYGGNGEIYVWDMDARECIATWYDDKHAPLRASRFARSTDYTACGSESGIVTIYSNSDMNKVISQGKGKRNMLPAPKKELKNIYTRITSLAINNQSEIMAVASMFKDGALRLVHLPTMTTFQNFPTKAYELGRINCVDFSPASGYLAFGNNKGTAYIYRLKHYEAY